ncbi:MAG TPA: hypothetical protein VND22_09805 [Actinomycetota bacterium]|nr:hypothetical protein [Actinomycetota bacterium]
MRRAWPIVTLCVMFLISVPFVTPYLRGDGLGYYAWMASPITDGDLHFADEYSHGNEFVRRDVFNLDGSVRDAYKTKTGHLRNPWGAGAAIFWAPFFLVAQGISALLGGDLEGFSTTHLWLVAFGSALYAFMGIVISYAVCRRFFGKPASFVAALAVWGATSLPVYQYFLPFWPFAVGTFASALLVWLWMRAGWQPLRWFVVGVLGGLLASIHPVAVAWNLLPAASFVRRPPEAKGKQLKAATAWIAGGVTGMIPQLIGKGIVYGSPLHTGYQDEVNFLQPRFLKVFFGSDHGLFLWTPLAILAFVGLIVVARKHDRTLGWGLLAVFAGMSWIVAGHHTPELSSFGNRFFVLFTPGFLVGTAAIFEKLWARRRAVVVALAAALILWNALLAFQWAWGMTPKRSGTRWSVVLRNQFGPAERELAVAMKLFFTDRAAFLERVNAADLEEADPLG